MSVAESIESMDMLLLSVPVQHTADNPAVEQDPRRLKHWLESLPMEDVEKTVSALSAAIKPFNELNMVSKTRLRLLEVYNQALDTILYTYDELHLRTLPISLEQRRALSEDIMWLYLELANGYKSIVKDEHESSQGAITRGERVLCLYRAMELIGHALIYAYRHHQAAPPLAYLELHQLYFLAEHYADEQESVDAGATTPGPTTVKALYIHLMLLVAGDPYAVEGNRVFELFLLLKPFADAAELLPQFETSGVEDSYYIDFMEDHGPRSCLYHKPEILLPHQRVLQIGGAIEQVISALRENKRIRSGNFSNEEARLLRLFVAALRRDVIEDVEAQKFVNDGRVAYGLTSSCYYLQHQESLLESSIEQTGGIEVRDMDIFETENELSSWKIANACSNGCVLMGGSDEQGAHFAVGEVVTLVERFGAVREPLVGTGLIRWVRYRGEELRLAVELLSGDPIVVECALDENKSDVTEIPPFEALYFPRNKTRTGAASLLMEYSYFKHASQFRVTVQGKQYRIAPVRVLTETPLYIQFGFKVIR